MACTAAELYDWPKCLSIMTVTAPIPWRFTLEYLPTNLFKDDLTYQTATTYIILYKLSYNMNLFGRLWSILNLIVVWRTTWMSVVTLSETRDSSSVSYSQKQFLLKKGVNHNCCWKILILLQNRYQEILDALFLKLEQQMIHTFGVPKYVNDRS